MNKRLLIFVGIPVLLVVAAVVVQKKMYSSPEVEDVESVAAAVDVQEEAPAAELLEANSGDYFVTDYLYAWDDQILDWVIVDDLTPQSTLTSAVQDIVTAAEPVKIEWNLLTDIKYQLKYFEEIDMDIYAPVFSEAIKKLHGKEVLITGFVIPFDETNELLALSANSYAACFFCGKASPASVMSLYVKDKGKRYKMDDFRTFRGKLYLNHDDPNEYYYILRNAKIQ